MRKGQVALIGIAGLVLAAVVGWAGSGASAHPSPARPTPTSTPIPGASQARLTFAAFSSVPSPRRSIAYMQIYTANANGSGEVQLTRNNQWHEGPKWSVDRSQIVFSAKADVANASGEEIYIMNADGSNVRRLTTNAYPDSQPHLAPDNQSLVFTAIRSPGSGADIYTMSLDGSGVANLTPQNTGDDADPRFSPDGTKIAFSSDRAGNTQVYVTNSDGSSVQRITNNSYWDFDPAWSSNGRYLVFGSYRGEGSPIDPETGDVKFYDWYIIKVDLEDPAFTETQLTFTSSAVDWAPVFSPDGSQIAFVSLRGGTAGLWVMNADGSAVRALVDSPTRNEMSIDWR